MSQSNAVANKTAESSATLSRSTGKFSSISKKVLMAATGLFLCTFLIVHLSGNLQLLIDDGGRAFNEYTRFMTTNSLIRLTEIGLVLGFLGHIVFGLLVSRQNARARPQRYLGGYRSTALNSWFARTMKWSGLLILVFLVVHLKSFWYEYQFGPIETVVYDGEEYKNMYLVVQAAFAQWWYVLLYVISMIVLGLHLNHGFQSAFQSLGLNSSTYRPIFSRIGSIFAVVVSLGFALLPLYMFIAQL